MELNILILTDSLALPRLQPEYCHQNDTWPSLLRREGHQVTQISIGGGTSKDLVSQCYYYKKETLDIDLVLVQSGIVDCAPRFASQSELNFYRKIPFFGKGFIYLLNRNLIKRIRKITYVKPGKYAKNLTQIKENFAPYPVFFLSILPAQDAYEKQLNGIQKNTTLYNRILKENVPVIDLSEIPFNGIMSDFHHLNADGHRFVFEQLQKVVDSVSTKN